MRGDIPDRVKPINPSSPRIECSRVCVGDNAALGPESATKQLDREERRLGNGREVRVRLGVIPEIAVVRAFTAPEVRIMSLDGKPIEAFNRLAEATHLDMELTSERDQAFGGCNPRWARLERTNAEQTIASEVSCIDD